MTGALVGSVAVVAGGTRGAGRGIAVELGAAGATVYVTGRSTRHGPSPMGRPETIEATAEPVTAAGGEGVEGVAVRVGHTVAEEVEALFARVGPNETDASTCWSTTSGAATPSPSGASRSGSTTWPRSCACRSWR